MTPSNLISLDGKIFLYKGEAKQPEFSPKLNQDFEKEFAQTFLVEDQDLAKDLICKQHFDGNLMWQIEDFKLYSVSVEMESVEQYKHIASQDWHDGTLGKDDMQWVTERQMFEYRTIARIKKEESKPDKWKNISRMIDQASKLVSPTPVEEKGDLKAKIQNILWDFGDHGCVHYEPYVTQIIELLTPKTPESREKYIVEVTSGGTTAKLTSVEPIKSIFVNGEEWQKVVTPNEESQEKLWGEL